MPFISIRAIFTVRQRQDGYVSKLPKQYQRLRQFPVYIDWSSYIYVKETEVTIHRESLVHLVASRKANSYGVYIGLSSLVQAVTKTLFDHGISSL